MSQYNLTKIVTDSFSKVTNTDFIAYITVVFISFLSYGQSVLDITYNNDGIGRFIHYNDFNFFNSQTYLTALTKGRWAYPFFENLYNGVVALPFLVTVITIFLLVFNSTIIWKLFKIEKLLHKILIGGLLCSSPLFTHYFFYTGDAEVYATGMLLISLSVNLLTKIKKSKKIIGVCLSVIALACYPALFGYYTGLISLYALNTFYKHETIKAFFIKTFKLISLAVSSLIIYVVLTKLMVFICGLEMTSYKNANSISIIQLIKNLPYKLFFTYLMFVHFCIKAHLIVKVYVLLIGISLIYFTSKQTNKKLIYLLLVLFFMIPLLNIMYLITYEDKYYEGFLFGFIPFLALLHLPLLKSESNWIKNTILIIPILLIFFNIKSANQIILKYRLNCESSRALSLNIINEIQKHPEFNISKKIALIGNIKDNSNFEYSNYIPETIALNGMMFPVALNGNNKAHKFSNQLKLLGLKFDFTENEKTDSLETFFNDKNLPEFPKTGSIFEYNNVIIVNLGFNKKSLLK